MLSSSLLFSLLTVGLCLAVPTKVAEIAPAQNELNAAKEATAAEVAVAGDVKTRAGELEAGDVPSPLISPPSIVPSENEDNFGGVSAFGEGHFVNEEYGYAGKGVAAGIAGGVANDKGVAAGGAGYAAGIAGVDTKPFKGFVSLSTDGQGTINNFGEKAEPFKLEVGADVEAKKTEAVPNSPTKAETSEEKAPTLGIPTIHHTIGALFRPIQPLSPPHLFNTLTGGIFQPNIIKDAEKDASSDTPSAPRDETAEAAEEESAFYSFIKPLTPSGIAANVATIFKPLTTISGQAQGSITLTGGASYTGNPPDDKPHPPPHHEKPPPPPPHHEQPPPPHHATEGKPEGCGKPPHHEDDKVTECKAVCKKNGKVGGALTSGGCCTCSCPVPEVHFGELCCSGSKDACNAHCKKNPHHSYSGGTCNPHTKACECRCSPWEPWWAPDVAEIISTQHVLSLPLPQNN